MKHKNDVRKIVLIGTGMVGMSFAYCLLNQTICDELVLIDLDRKRAEGEAMDLNHGLAFAPGNMHIYAGSYHDCHNADIVTICAGVAQKPGETRLDLLKRNADVFQSIVEPVVTSGFSGIFLIATNPVDIMAHITQKISGFPPERVIGSGTALDSARLRYLLGQALHVDPRNIHAYVMGEHGDSEFVPWSQALLSTKPILQICKETNLCQTSGSNLNHEILSSIANEVKNAAYAIIDAKRATYYGIGMALTRICKSILGNENSVLTVSAFLNGEYKHENVYAGVPCILNQNGVRRILELDLTDDEMEKFDHSCQILRNTIQQLSL